MHQRTVHVQGHLLAGRHERSVAGGQARVDFVVVLALHVKNFTVVAGLADPFEVDAPRLLAELEHHDFFRLGRAADLLAPRHADDVGIDAGVPAGAVLLQLAQGNGLRLRIRGADDAGWLTFFATSAEAGIAAAGAGGGVGRGGGGTAPRPSGTGGTGTTGIS